MADKKPTVCTKCGLPHPAINPYCFCGPDFTVEEWVKRTVDEMFEAARRATEAHTPATRKR